MSFADEWEAEEVVCGLVDDLVAGAEAELRAKELKAAVIPLTVSTLSATISDVVKCYFVDHDAGEPELKAASNWSVGAEPEPASIDSWSRGAVAVKRTEAPALADGNLSARTSTPRGKTPGSENGEGRAARVPDALPQPDPKAAMFIAKPEPGKVLFKAKKGNPIVTQTERRLKRLDAEAREEVARLDRLKSDLKGREYTYDAHGHVIVLEDMAADKLPPFQQQPRLGLSGSGRGGGAASAAANGGKGGKGGGRGKGGRGGGGGSGSSASLNFTGSATFKQLDSLQPSLLETMGVGAGVRLTQGEGSKGGEARVFDGERMSKAVFEQVANMSGGFTSRRPVAGGDPASPGGDNASRSAVDVPPPTPIMPAGGSMGNRAGSSDSVEPAMRPPYMPTSPEPGDNLGQRNSLTRERGGMPTKTRLPPPALGATTGHGQGVPYCQRGEPSSPSAGGNSVTASTTSVRR